MNKQEPIYKRVILKITGELFAKPYETYTPDIAMLSRKGVELAIVVGGGNIIRGRESNSISKVVADQMGMVATVINALYLQEVLKKNKTIEVRIQNIISAQFTDFTEPYTPTSAVNNLKKGRIIILAGGTGHPGCTTDSAAVLRAIELGAEAILKGTKVDGLFDKNPKLNKDAVLIPEIYCHRSLTGNFEEIFETTALYVAREAKIPIHIFNIFRAGNLWKVICGEQIGTKIVP